MSRRIITSLLTILVAAVVVVGATTAFFSDTETSVGNTFAAGDIDLQIDNTSYAIDWNIPGFQNPTGAFVASTHTSWTMRDLTVEKFFDFVFPIYTKLFNSESRTLAAIRDALLPKLISGELRVSDAEKFIEETV